MIEVGGIYKLKKIKDFIGINTEDEYKVLKISGDIVYCQNQQTKELNMFNKKDFINPEFPDDIYSDFNIIMEKLDTVMRPMNLSFWKELKEDAMASTGAAVPALSTGGVSGSTGMAALGSTPTTGCRVNGIAVAGQSVKSKKKKKKKNETVPRTLSNVLEHCHVGRNTVSNIIIPEKNKINETICSLTLDDIMEQVEETFDPQDILCTEIKNNREYIMVQVGYTNPEDKALTHTINLLFLDEARNVIDEIQQEDLTQQECLDILNELAYNHTQVELDEDFREEYEEITGLIAQQLDRMNFEFANTEDIVYKKEGKYKYLLKFDNENGILKFKVSQNDNVLFEKEWQLEEGQDISPIFTEIQEVYEEYGI